MRYILLSMMVAFTVNAYAIDPIGIIITQDDSPVTIDAYGCSYREDTSRTVREGIYHSVNYTNTSNRPIVAVRIAFVSFNVFNTYINRFAGISMDVIVPGNDDRGAWRTNPSGAFSFLTGVAYVSAVRFQDGTIWEADNEVVLEELRKIQDDFDSQLLDDE